MDLRTPATKFLGFLSLACLAGVPAVSFAQAQFPIVVSPLPLVVVPVQVGQSAQTIITLTNTTDSATAIGVGDGRAGQLTDCDAIEPNFDGTHGPWPDECWAQRAQGDNSIHVNAIGCANVAAHSTCSVIITFTPHIALPTAGTLQIGPPDSQSTLPLEQFGFVAQALPPQTTPGTVLAVEYIDRDLTHFFVTSIPGEIQALDDGDFPPWVRTGRSFWVYPPGNPIAVGESPVCRYFTTPDAGFNTHFYSEFPQECNAIPTLFPGLWTLETMDAFGVLQPNSATGACPLGTSPLYRTYNGGPNVNHRYMTSLDTRALMAGHLLSWIPEGYGPLGFGMCVPQ
ncbi:MAG TPA: hypothetical protein VGR63_12775 [Casimicrobiaceae bacterium]|jgi:hypothetical protein|nr:hypothetical protein [Casimicrobiaceae bacterium]